MFFSILGHGGADCSQFCAENFERFLLHRLKVTRLKNDENGAILTADKDNLEGILRQTLLDLDAAFCRHWRTKTLPAPGSTATVALIRGGYELVTGHIGRHLDLQFRLNLLHYEIASIHVQIKSIPIMILTNEAF